MIRRVTSATRQQGAMNNTMSSPTAGGAANTAAASQMDVDDADVAAGLLHQEANQGSKSSTNSVSSSGTFGKCMDSAPSSLATINTNKGHPMDLEFFEDLVSEPVLVLGVDISHLPRQTQFIVCAVGVFSFSLLYGYLQELISVKLCNRKLGLFQAMTQFTGYTVLAYFLRNFVYRKQKKHHYKKMQSSSPDTNNTTTSKGSSIVPSGSDDSVNSSNLKSHPIKAATVPLLLYIGLSLLRAVDLAMTNLAMQYINYPAKTLMKSSRVVFTMLFGVLISRKVYHTADYLIVMCMVAGLAIFMHADANSSAVFHYAGVIMLTVSLICDGAISNISETIMAKFGVGQDEFIFRMYSIALVAIVMAAAGNGDLRQGLYWLQQPGTYDEVMQNVPLEDRTWSVPAKMTIMVLFSSMGFFGSSCSAAITKNFGALTMSITSTARKATTLFLSFFLFHNVCTVEHLVGVVMFIAALTAKSLRRGRKGGGNKSSSHKRQSDNKNDWLQKLMTRRQRRKQLSSSTPETIQAPLILGRRNSRDGSVATTGEFSSPARRGNRRPPPPSSLNQVHIV